MEIQVVTKWYYFRMFKLGLVNCQHFAAFTELVIIPNESVKKKQKPHILLDIALSELVFIFWSVMMQRIPTRNAKSEIRFRIQYVNLTEITVQKGMYTFHLCRKKTIAILPKLFNLIFTRKENNYPYNSKYTEDFET